MVLRSINPATEEVVEEFEPHDDAEIERRLARAAEAFGKLRRTSPEERAYLLLAVAELLESGKERWGRLLTEEMGKTLASAVAEVEKCAWVCRHYAENGPRMLADRELPSDAARSFVRHLPIGPVLAVMPWNFPFWQLFRCAAPAIMAGNVILLKHASNVPRCALAIEDIFGGAGPFTDAVVQTLLIGSNKVGAVIDDGRVAAVSLTGSVGAGAKVAERAGRQIKKSVLELGGSDPYIVMPSADLERAVETAVTARIINNGQSCIAAKRFIVHEAIYDSFTEAMVQRMNDLTMGDPMDEATKLGPLATAEGLATVERQVGDSVAAGARLLTGGQTPQRSGYFYPATVLADIPHDSPAYCDEIFGPVATLLRASGLDESIRIANDSRFGLGSSVWTGDPEEQEQFVNRIEAGLTFVNAMVASDPRLPFGGVKQSGYGRELGELGIHEFVNCKTVSFA